MPRGFTVALVGADGAGKTTIALALERELPFSARYLYMGDNVAALNRALPTTRLIRKLKRGRASSGGPPERRSAERAPSGRHRAPLRMLRSTLRVAHQLADEWYRQLVAWRHVRRGDVVLFDRHFYFDYRAHDVAGGRDLPWSRRLHGFVLRRLYPRPNLVIVLDAPEDVLYARKPEGSFEAVTARRHEYLGATHAGNAVATIDAARPLAEVKADVARIVERYALEAGVDVGRAEKHS